MQASLFTPPLSKQILGLLVSTPIRNYNEKAIRKGKTDLCLQNAFDLRHTVKLSKVTFLSLTALFFFNDLLSAAIELYDDKENAIWNFFTWGSEFVVRDTYIDGRRFFFGWELKVASKFFLGVERVNITKDNDNSQASDNINICMW